MAQDAVIEIADPAIRIVKLAVLILRNRINGQITAQQILLQRDIRCGITGKTGVAFALFAFNSGQCILFFRLRMQKYGKIPSDRLITQI